MLVMIMNMEENQGLQFSSYCISADSVWKSYGQQDALKGLTLHIPCGKQDFRFVAHAGQFYTMKPKPMGGRGHEVIKNINRKEL